MDAKQCDLCGKFYIPIMEGTLIDDFAKAFRNVFQLGAERHIISFFESELDLCSDCANALYEFLKSRKSDNNAE